MELSKETEEKIFGLRQIAFAFSREKKYDDAIAKMMEAWSQFPEPRETAVMSNVIAEDICKIYLFKTKDYEKAMHWADIIHIYYLTSGAIDQGDGELWKGKVYFEMGDMEEAKKQFRISFQKSEGRGWENVPKEYIDLLKNK